MRWNVKHTGTLFGLVMCLVFGWVLGVTPCHAAGFATTGSMAVASASHSLTLLPNGKVLVAGGYNSSNGTLSRAELYDPSTGTFSTTGSMITARNEHSATLLPNGKILIAGGHNSSGYINGAELYDPQNGTFTSTGSLATARAYHAATLLPNGKVLIAGGESNSVN